MSPLDSLLHSRRSIRKFLPTIPDATTIESLILAASTAPSPSNSAPVRFLQFSSAKIRETFRQAMTDGYQALLNDLSGLEKSRKLRNRIEVYWRFSQSIFEAPVLFAVGTLREAEGFSAKLHRAGLTNTNREGDMAPLIAVGLSLQAFTLKATELGMGCCVMSTPLTFIEDIEGTLGISDLKICCFLTLGYPSEIPEAPDKGDFRDLLRSL